MTLTRCEFDEHYIQALRDGVPEISEHFALYFGELLSAKLRKQVRSPEMAEDAKQETLLRVLECVRRQSGLRDPERLGAFVLGVCNRVLLETWRQAGRYQEIENCPEPADFRTSPEEIAAEQQSKRRVDESLARLPKRDQELIRMVYLEERDRFEVSRQLHVGQAYLRVLLQRALVRFKRAAMVSVSATPEMRPQTCPEVHSEARPHTHRVAAHVAARGVRRRYRVQPEPKLLSTAAGSC